MKQDEIKSLISTAKQTPGVAHLPAFGLVIYSGKWPVCELCGGVDAPIVNGKHLSPEKFCKVTK